MSDIASSQVDGNSQFPPERSVAFSPNCDGIDPVDMDEAEVSSDGTDSHLCLSDDEDIFDMKACPETSLNADYKKPYLYLKSRAVAQVARLLRDDPLVPLSIIDYTGNTMNVDDHPLQWPSWHCAFKGCTAQGDRNPKKEPKDATSKHVLLGENHIKISGRMCGVQMIFRCSANTNTTCQQF